ncbi:MAG: 2-octaprenyl-6-methoxyphenyl hydroxylase [gamma proteobacterium symbiont of Ctena orbiculata]|uniref:2-octaprenyl-6-methoxyphenyl hydroxylase n=1 Tax=Candidatus Thiodiazotropha taylori TaxID=2792791 RepID=A0A944M5K4_9GAMM|nr:2-octaprenyl-6-methoxyphenyl hydroxylase [Candidatus Thiodiazotropha taylori]PUB82652.1 MAG: 2-octaprenyl-6-methoxyphenyl hydroxylase [gamma proteobacterium symbiont of Ctena orbiculata]MBV2137741.1 2-octaprenyl-6-methoxyphenyl hydroxylase [Candidatus Thiodiazotropha taylori]PVV09952.1 MAG: 2-octaprenyl-6-methoxyphenyl hydroxylase [gamma proteobacterium symbiont of Ctena orbiculata]PVV13617.1 MAG: 2-octaprenyl-6-methoxyphenyl hydroxylase [gamma proteobacterium symbiont of Ctena orbiculata]
MAERFDLLIVGGGMVGVSLAHAVSGLGYRIGVIEAWPLESSAQPSFDDRVIALSWGSRVILEAMGVWRAVERAAEPIQDVHISDRGHFGFTRLSHHQEGVAALGYVVTARALGKALMEDMAERQAIELICPAKLKSFSISENEVEVRIEQDASEQRLSTSLLVAADGGDSQVRQFLSIPLREKPYGQTAIIANLRAEQPHRGIAYERFTDTGPLALLPMRDDRLSMVWTARDKEVADLMALRDEAFLLRLQDRFGYRLGRLSELGKRSAYPLRLRQAAEQVRSRVALIGNAAHAIHPVTGQGFNLGLRDVAVLADLLFDASQRGQDPGDDTLLKAYASWRKRDQNSVALITDTLARLFANPFGPLRLVRNLGMVGLDLAPSLKHLVARQFMGLNGRLPRLARGVSLD